MIPFEDLIGAPYEEGGRGPKKWDCFGILREMSRRYGKDIPDYPSRGRADQHAQTIFKAMDEGWTELEEPELGCAVLIRVDGYASHVGVMVFDGHFMHCIEGQAVVVQSLNHPQWDDRIIGFYRWSGSSNEVAKQEEACLKSE